MSTTSSNAPPPHATTDQANKYDDHTPLLTVSKHAMEQFHDNVSSFWGSTTTTTILILDEPPSSLSFLRDHVGPSRPCVIRNVLLDSEDGRPLHLTLDQLVDQYPALELQVDVTPDGHGDCIRRVRVEEDEQDAFVQPQQQTMPVTQFRDCLRRNHVILSDAAEGGGGDGVGYSYRNRVFGTSFATDALETTTTPSTSSSSPPPPGVVYYSRQNDCLRTELAPVAAMLPATIDFAEHAIGTGPPDAVNLWMGNGASVSSFHKDPYENLFYVLSGTKVFYLCPPADAIVLKQQQYASGAFVHSDHDGQWQVRMDVANNGVRWIGADPTNPQDIARNPLLAHCHVMEVHVHAGEMLYLPSLWFHKVTQTCETVAVNYWYDMAFDAKWCYFGLMESLEAVPTGGAEADLCVSSAAT